MRYWPVVISIATMLGIAVAIAFGIMAWDHNPQGEYHDWETGQIVWSTFAPLIFTTFGFVFLIVLFFGLAVRLPIKFFQRSE